MSTSDSEITDLGDDPVVHALSRHLLGAGCLFTACCLLAAEQEAPKPDLSEYRTVEKVIRARVSLAPPGTAGQTGYLGVTVQRDGKGRVAVEEVQPDSPADRAGLKRGDIITRVGDQAVKTPESFREWLQARGPGQEVKLGLLREDKPAEVTATLAATSRPMKAGGPAVSLGVELGDPKEGGGVRVTRVAAGSPAAAAGVKTDDILAKVDGRDLMRAAVLSDILSEKRPGDTLTLVVRRDDKEVELTAKLAGGRGRGPGGFSRDGPPPSTPWKKELFRLAVVLIEFPDIKHNAKVTAKDWDEAVFSRKSYTKTSATGQAVHGSLNDYLQEQSHGALRIEGKVFDRVEAGKKRGDYVQGSGTSNKTVLLAEALDKVATRDGEDSFKNFDGVLFVYAGERARSNAGALYYPHAGTVSHQGRRLPYLIGPEGGARMTSVNGFVKEFGRLLGLPDLAARTENVGSEGLGVWCAMSTPLSEGRPQHFGAWSKEKLGWVKPAVIDPTVRQKLILSPIEDSPKECFKVLVRPDGSEYLLLENRRKKGFDTDLPGEGLLIWRVVNDRPILEESHGIEGPTGPTSHLDAVPYPSPANNAFTPETTPSSRSPLGGGLPVRITEVRRLPDGRVTFHIGYEYR
jgi:M6 family metalloprotease-like protein